eukprot:evm.model.scf_4101.1 EVM.evm.TU.scf_4101.1   scf_4101:3834-5681(+)
MAAQGGSMGRRAADIAQRARGRVPLKFEFQLMPICVSDLPRDITSVALLWERGSKIRGTKTIELNPGSGRGYWDEILRQVGTVYADEHIVVQRDYVLKLQSCGVGRKQQEVRTTVAKATINFAKYCEKNAMESSGPIKKCTIRSGGTTRPDLEETVFM